MYFFVKNQQQVGHNHEDGWESMKERERETKSNHLGYGFRSLCLPLNSSTGGFHSRNLTLDLLLSTQLFSAAPYI